MFYELKDNLIDWKSQWTNMEIHLVIILLFMFCVLISNHYEVAPARRVPEIIFMNSSENEQVTVHLLEEGMLNHFLANSPESLNLCQKGNENWKNLKRPQVKPHKIMNSINIYVGQFPLD